MHTHPKSSTSGASVSRLPAVDATGLDKSRARAVAKSPSFTTTLRCRRALPDKQVGTCVKKGAAGKAVA
jgi:hypothetical protein